MHRAKKSCIFDLNQHLTCSLCKGYFVDATTIIECLHTFCRSCIVKYLETNKYCPVCDVQVHKNKPLLNIRPDKILQDIVYKVVPKLFQNELQRRRDFVKNQPDKMHPSWLQQHQHLLTPDETISLILRYSGCEESTRYLRCPAAVSIGHLQKLLRAKYGLGEHHQIDILYNQDCLNSSLNLMDVAYIYLWKRTNPLELNYRIYEYLVEKKMKLNKTEPNPNYENQNKVQMLNNNWKEVQLRISENGEMSITDVPIQEAAALEVINNNNNNNNNNKIVDKVNNVSAAAKSRHVNKLKSSNVKTKTSLKSAKSEKNSKNATSVNNKSSKAASKATPSTTTAATTTTISTSATNSSTVATTSTAVSKTSISSPSKTSSTPVLKTTASVVTTTSSTPVTTSSAIIVTSASSVNVNTTTTSSFPVESTSATVATSTSSAKPASTTGSTKSVTATSSTKSVTATGSTKSATATATSSTKSVTASVATTSTIATSVPFTASSVSSVCLPQTSTSCASLCSTQTKTVYSTINSSKCSVGVSGASAELKLPPPPPPALPPPIETPITGGGLATTTTAVTTQGVKRKLEDSSSGAPKQKQTILNHSLSLHNLSNNHPLKKYSQSTTSPSPTSTSTNEDCFAKPLLNRNFVPLSRPGTPITTTSVTKSPCYMPKPPKPIINVPKPSTSTTKPNQQQQQQLVQPPNYIQNNKLIKSKASTPIGYKTLRDPPKSWNSQISKVNKTPTTTATTPPRDLLKPIKQAKFFKMRHNIPRYLGNPASGVKPMYVQGSPEKDQQQQQQHQHHHHPQQQQQQQKSEIKKHSIVKIDPKTLKPISEKAPETSSLSTVTSQELKINTSSVSIFSPLKLNSPKVEKGSKLSPPIKRDKLSLNFTPSNPFIPNLASPTVSPNQFLYPSGYPSYDPRFMAAYHTLLYGPRMAFNPLLDLNQSPPSPSSSSSSTTQQTSPKMTTQTTKEIRTNNNSNSNNSSGNNNVKKSEKSLQNTVEKLTQKISEIEKKDEDKNSV